MEKIKALPVQIILLIDTLKGEVRAIAAAKIDADREKALETALSRIEVINTIASNAAEEVGTLS